jgi:hypothetical protein
MVQNCRWLAMSCAYLLTACSARRPEPDDDAACTSARLACAELLHRGDLEGH